MNNNNELSFHSTAYICAHVFENVKPVRWVGRADGNWCFSCGDLHPDAESSYRVIGLGHVLANYPELNVLLDLLPNQEAYRTAIGKPWIRTDLTKKMK